jgi:hypothetical protein
LVCGSDFSRFQYKWLEYPSKNTFLVSIYRSSEWLIIAKFLEKSFHSHARVEIVWLIIRKAYLRTSTGSDLERIPDALMTSD